MSFAFIDAHVHCRDRRALPRPAGACPRWLDTALELVSHLPSADQDAIFRRHALRACRPD